MEGLEYIILRRKMRAVLEELQWITSAIRASLDYDFEQAMAMPAPYVHDPPLNDIIENWEDVVFENLSYSEYIAPFPVRHSGSDVQ